MSERLSALRVPNEDATKVKLAVFDFDGVFTDNTVYASKDGNHEYVRCYRGDGLGLKRLRKSSVETYVLSTETSPVVGIRCKKMDVEYQQGLENKAKALKELAENLGISLKAILYLGND